MRRSWSTTCATTAPTSSWRSCSATGIAGRTARSWATKPPAVLRTRRACITWTTAAPTIHHSILEIAQRILKDAENLRQVGEQFTEEDVGRLTIATTHTQARYALPQVVQQFTKRYPGVRLALRQGSPTQISEMVTSGEADIAIATRLKELGELHDMSLQDFIVYTARATTAPSGATAASDNATLGVRLRGGNCEYCQQRQGAGVFFD